MDWRDFPSLSALRAFDAMARHGGFSQAAQALNVTHAAIAQQVRGLERHMNQRLAVRQGRGLQLTPEGRQLADALDQGFSGIADCLVELGRASDKKRLRVTTTQFLVDSRILPNLPDFWRLHPGVEISFYPSRLPVDVVDEGFDFGIQYSLPGVTQHASNVEIQRLKEATMVAVAAPGVVEQYGRDPYACPWIKHEDFGPKYGFMRAAGLDLERIRWVDIGSPAILITAVREGVGLSMFNAVIAAEYLENGTLVTVPTPISPPIDYCAVIPKGPRPPIVDEFVSWVTTLL